MLRRLAQSALDLRAGARSTLVSAPPDGFTGITGFAAATLLSAFVFTGLFTTTATARTPLPPAPQEGTVVLAELPPEGQKTYGLIRSGGPFPFEKDGVVFGNREKQLPLYRRGYYREYTVATPKARDRGARRIVCGGAPRNPERCFYTADHYASFREIVE